MDNGISGYLESLDMKKDGVPTTGASEATKTLDSTSAAEPITSAPATETAMESATPAAISQQTACLKKGKRSIDNKFRKAGRCENVGCV